MTAHELARLLLAGPDSSVGVAYDGDVYGIKSVWLDYLGHVAVSGGSYCPACWGDHDEGDDGCPVVRAEVPK